MGDPTFFELEVILMLNKIRIEHGRNPVEIDRTLAMENGSVFSGNSIFFLGILRKKSTLSSETSRFSQVIRFFLGILRKKPTLSSKTAQFSARFHSQIMATFGVKGNWSHHVGPYEPSAPFKKQRRALKLVKGSDQISDHYLSMFILNFEVLEVGE